MTQSEKTEPSTNIGRFDRGPVDSVKAQRHRIKKMHLKVEANHSVGKSFIRPGKIEPMLTSCSNMCIYFLVDYDF